jgi:hypothetical protein
MLYRQEGTALAAAAYLQSSTAALVGGAQAARCAIRSPPGAHAHDARAAPPLGARLLPTRYSGHGSALHSHAPACTPSLIRHLPLPLATGYHTLLVSGQSNVVYVPLYWYVSCAIYENLRPPRASSRSISSSSSYSTAYPSTHAVHGLLAQPNPHQMSSGEATDDMTALRTKTASLEMEMQCVKRGNRPHLPPPPSSPPLSSEPGRWSLGFDASPPSTQQRTGFHSTYFSSGVCASSASSSSCSRRKGAPAGTPAACRWTEPAADDEALSASCHMHIHTAHMLLCFSRHSTAASR